MKTALLISEARGYGGAEVYLDRLGEGLAGWDARLMIPDRPPLDFWRRSLEKRGRDIRCYPSGVKGTPLLIRAVRDPNVALVHVNLPSTYDGGCGTLAWTLAKASGKPVVTTEHLTRIPRSRRRRWLKLRTAGALSAVITVSESSRRDLITEGLDPDRVTTVLNGVPDPGPPRPLPEPRGGLRVGVVASLEPRKRLDVLIDAVAGCSAPRPRVQIAGEGPQRDALVSRARASGLREEEMAFLGRVDDIRGFLSQQEVLALPSSLEAMPLSVLESFAAGRGVLLSDLPGMDELLDGEAPGSLLPMGDVTAWMRALETLTKDRERVARWSLEARRRFESRFTLAASVEATAALYARVLETAGRV